MLSDTFNHGYCSKLCWQLSSADANGCALVQSYSSVAVQRWMLAGAWHRRSVVGLRAASQAPANAAPMGTPWLRLCSQAQPITRKSDHEVLGLVVSWTMPSSVAVLPTAHRLISHAPKRPAACH